MKNSKLLVIAFLMLSMVFVGYQCGSTEITSAKLYISQKNWDKALEVLEKEIVKNPKSIEGYYWMGEVYREKGDVPKMLENFNKSLSYGNTFEKEIKDKKYTAWASAINKGSALFQRTTKMTDADSIQIVLDKSIAELSASTLIEPDSALGYQYLSYAYLTKNDMNSAIAPLNKLIELNKAVDGYKFLGEIYSANGANLKNEGKLEESKAEYNKSIQILEEGLKAHPNESELLLRLSNAYIGADRTSEAIEPFRKGVEAEPTNQYYRYNYGVLLLGAEDFAGAETQFKKAIEIDPNYDNAIYNLGVTYLKWGTYLNKKADEEGKVADDYKAKYQLALPYLEKAVQMKDVDAQTWELLGRVYSVLGMADDATNAFKKADELRK
ncbi:MAG: tetratricopeptide repeat protein [Ignavibacteriaceae bacterium]